MFGCLNVKIDLPVLETNSLKILIYFKLNPLIRAILLSTCLVYICYVPKPKFSIIKKKKKLYSLPLLKM